MDTISLPHQPLYSSFRRHKIELPKMRTKPPRQPPPPRVAFITLAFYCENGRNLIWILMKGIFFFFFFSMNSRPDDVFMSLMDCSPQNDNIYFHFIRYTYIYSDYIVVRRTICTINFRVPLSYNSIWLHVYDGGVESLAVERKFWRPPAKMVSSNTERRTRCQYLWLFHRASFNSLNE